LRVYTYRTINSDNIIYIDRATGVLCEAKINYGDIKYDLIIVSWANKTVEDFKQPSDGWDIFSQIDGFSVPILIASSSLFLILLRSKVTYKKN
jgi:hypothetical protein